MTSKDAVNIVRLLSDLFFLVRISNPETNEVFDLNENDEFVPITTCYHVWGRSTPCIHCSTLRTCRQRITTDKYEVMDNEVFHVTSKPIDIDGHLYALEIVTKLDNSKELTKRILYLEMEGEALEAQRKAADIANKAKTSFLFNMSHDIRTPMNAIIGFNDMAMRHLDDSERVKDCLAKVDMSSKHLLSIINDVLDMARIESGKVTIEEKPMSLKKVSEELCNIVTQNVKDKNLTMTTDFSHITHDFVIADELRVNRVMMNLISNSIKYTPEGGTVSYTVTEEAYYADGTASYEFVVADNGIGMSPEYLEHVFEAFSRERSSTINSIQGTGLGMAITKELVELLGGTICITSEEGIGTTVTVHLSFKTLDEQNYSDADEATVISPVSLKGKRVLLAEDNELNREIAMEILEEADMQVVPAENGQVAVDLFLNDEPFDVILMDVQMPVLDGYEATAKIREAEANLQCHVPIIATTANAYAEDIANCRKAGMDAHLAKPIDVQKMFSVLSDIMK